MASLVKCTGLPEDTAAQLAEDREDSLELAEAYARAEALRSRDARMVRTRRSKSDA